MNKTEFIYNSLSPAPYNVPQKNKVTVWIEDGKIHYHRQYISENGKESSPIGQAFEENATAYEIAKMIHWGCSGTSNYSAIHSLIDNVQPIVESLKKLLAKPTK